MNIDKQLEEVEAEIKQLQGRAALLRRVKEIPPEELISQFHTRFRSTLSEFRASLLQLRAHTSTLFDELAAALGCSDRGELPDWVNVAGELGELFRDARNAAEDFTSDTDTAFVEELRHDIERLFLRLHGRYEEPGWYEEILRKESEPAAAELDDDPSQRMA